MAAITDQRPRGRVITTNDVRVLRLLSEHGPLTRDEIAAELRHGLGAPPALRRLEPLLDRDLIAASGTIARPLLDATAEGIRALRAADRASWGRWA